MRARNAFLASAELTGGVVGGVSITSEKGRDCTFVNPWPGRTVRLVRAGKPGELLASERFTFKTAINESIEITPNQR